MGRDINKKTLRERECYNEGVRDALKEIWLYDGLIPDEISRENMLRRVQEKVSYKHPEPKPLVLIP